MKEKFLKSQPRLPKFMLHHDDSRKIAWDLFVMMLALWNCVTIPYDVSFEPDKHTIFTILEVLVDIFFAIDICLTFRTSFVDATGFEEVRATAIALNYLKMAFWLDLASTIPLEAIASSLQSDELKLLGLLKLVRLLRLARILRYLRVGQGAKVGVRML